jgi:hypothetical protein
MIHLEHKHLIGMGRTRTCYRHPHDHEKCIKIDHRAVGGATAKEVFMTLGGLHGGSLGQRAAPTKNADLKASAMDRIDRPYKVCVATLTRQRCRMLSALLVSWRQMVIPASVELMFLVVENDTEPNSRELVDEHAGEFPHHQPLHYVLETELGIPFARNRAASYAIHHGCDLLAFVDDDEVVAEYWLVRLMDGYRNGHAVLLGAPLRIARLTEEVGFWRKIMYRNVAHRYARKERRAARLANLNETPRVTIVTNNWLAELSLFLPEGHGLRFDESMRFTGGTDAKFHAEVKQRGLATGWVRDALVYETVPVSRLSFRYQLKRARDQANTHSLRIIHERRFGRLVLMLKVIPKLAGLLLLCAIVPFTFSRTLLPVARSAGWLMGAARAIAGYRSDLYAKVTGH